MVDEAGRAEGDTSQERVDVSCLRPKRSVVLVGNLRRSKKICSMFIEKLQLSTFPSCYRTTKTPCCDQHHNW